MADEDDDEREVSESRIISVFAGCNRRHRWWLAESTQLVNLCAKSYLDLRQVVADPDAAVIDMSIVCAFGSVTVIVPEGTDVTLSGMSLLASSNSLVDRSEQASHLPRLEIQANTIFGRMRVRTGDVASGKAQKARKRVRQLPVAEPETELEAPTRSETGTFSAADDDGVDLAVVAARLPAQPDPNGVEPLPAPVESAVGTAPVADAPVAETPVPDPAAVEPAAGPTDDGAEDPFAAAKARRKAEREAAQAADH